MLVYSALILRSPMLPSRILNQSDIVLSNEDFMLVGRGSVNFEPAPPGEEPLAAADTLDSNATSRLDDDLTSYARSREALQCKCPLRVCCTENAFRVVQDVS